MSNMRTHTAQGHTDTWGVPAAPCSLAVATQAPAALLIGYTGGSVKAGLQDTGAQGAITSHISGFPSEDVLQT